MMKNKLLHRKKWLLIALVMMGSGVFAQEQLYLYAGLGIGAIDNYDIGTTPYHIKGLAMAYDLGASFACDRYLFQIDARYNRSTLTTMSGTNQALDVKASVLYRCIDSKDDRFHYYAGGSLQGYGEVKDVPALMNASNCISLFVNLCGMNIVSYDFAFNEAKTHHWLTAYGKLTLPIVGAVNRPDFAYTIDGQGMGYFEWFFANQETFAKFFPGCTTDLGLCLNLRNGNRIGLNYRWDYLSTGRRGIWRYDNAYHTISLDFLFKIN